MSVRARAALIAGFLGAACQTTPQINDTGSPVDARVTAFAETERVGGTGDAADDPAIWITPDPADSLVIGTDKTAGLYTYTLDGAVRQFLPVGRLNNVDLRPGFEVAGNERVLIAASDRTNNAVMVFFLDPATGEINADDAKIILLDIEPYGFCMGLIEGRYFAYVNAKTGEIVQLELRKNRAGVSAKEVRRLSVPSQPEGCVVDDRSGTLYVGEEAAGVWRFDGRADGPLDGDRVISIEETQLVADVEGLALYPMGKHEGYLIASSQGDDAYAVYGLPELGYQGRFRVIDGESIDGTSETDGIEITTAALPGRANGVFLAQDDANDDGGQNFKLVDWDDIAAGLSLKMDSAPAGE